VRPKESSAIQVKLRRVLLIAGWLGLLLLSVGYRSLSAQIATPATATATAIPTTAPTTAIQLAGAEPAYLGAVTTATAKGATIQQIVPDSPAAQAGLQIGDVIQSVDGQPVTMQTPLSALLIPHVPGDLTLFVIVRGGTTATIPVTLGSRPASLATDAPLNSSGGSTSAGGYLGIGLAALNPGFQVAKVASGSGAYKAGIKVDDLITAMDSQTITSVKQAHAIIASHAPGTTMQIALLRGDQPLTVTATLSSVPGATTSTPTITSTSVSTAAATLAASGTATSTASPATIAPSSTPPGVRLGVTYNVLTAGLATARGLAVTDGALITSVVPGSPADIAGIKVGDVVTAVDGQPIDVEHPLSSRTSGYHDGDTFILTIARAGQTLKISVTLAVSGSA